jgi:hypothetical protein
MFGGSGIMNLLEPLGAAGATISPAARAEVAASKEENYLRRVELART